MLLPTPSLIEARHETLTRWSGPLAATAVPVLLALGILIADWRAIASPTVATPELHRLLLAASGVAVLFVPAAIAFASAPGRVAAESLPPLSGRREHLALALVVAAFGVIVCMVIAFLGPLGWDESVYAIKSGELLNGWPSTGWGVHRPPLLSVLGLGPLLLGSDEALLRSLNLVFGLVGIIGTWYLARAMAGARAAVLAVLLVAGISTLQYQAGLFLNDVPSASLVIVLMLLVWNTMEGDSPIGWSILWWAPLAVATFNLRYGTILPLAGVVLATFVLWPRRVREAWIKHVVLGGLALMLLVPHMILAIKATGSPLGVIFTAEEAAAGSGWGSSFLTYAVWLPWKLGGPLAAAAVSLGAAGAIRRLGHAAVTRRWSRHVRGPAFLLLVSLVQVIGLGSIHAEPRYLLLPMMLLCIAASVIIVDGITNRGAAGRALFAGAALSLMVGLGATGVDSVRQAATGSAHQSWPRAAGLLIRELGQGDCAVVASDIPVITWYSHCPTLAFAPDGMPTGDFVPTAANQFLLVRSDGRLQPPAEAVERYLARASPRPIAVFTDRSGTLHVSLYRLR